MMAKPEHPPSNGWDRHSILAEIRRQKMPISFLAQQADMSPNAFSHVWTRVTRAAEEVISDFLETPAKELWPDRYPIQSSYFGSTKSAGLSASQKQHKPTDNAVAA
jgi:Ner family transcriptional regulator